MIYKTINDIFPNFSSNGIFNHFSNNNYINSETIQSLNIMYHGLRSGSKIACKLLHKLTEDEIEISDANADLICKTIEIKYKKNWDKLYNTLLLEYNAIENYSMTEEENSENNNTNNKNGNISTTESGTETDTENGTDTLIKTGNDKEAMNGAVESENKVAAYNSETYSLDNKTTDTYNGRENTKTYNTTDTNSKTNTNVKSFENRKTTNEISEGINNKNIGKRTLTRKGNIGVTTSQQMIQSERELWLWNFYEQIFSDIDREITLDVFL